MVVQERGWVARGEEAWKERVVRWEWRRRSLLRLDLGMGIGVGERGKRVGLMDGAGAGAGEVEEEEDRGRGEGEGGFFAEEEEKRRENLVDRRERFLGGEGEGEDLRVNVSAGLLLLLLLWASASLLLLLLLRDILAARLAPSRLSHCIRAKEALVTLSPTLPPRGCACPCVSGPARTTSPQTGHGVGILSNWLTYAVTRKQDWW